MKTFAATRSRAHQTGSVLVVAIVTAVILGITLASYLLMVGSHRAAVARSQAWNMAIATAESGIEEALAHLNPAVPAVFPADLGAHDWGAAVNGLHGPKTRSLESGSYSVVLTAERFPHIYSTGYVQVPALSANIKRVVAVQTTNVSLFTAALAVMDRLDAKGNGVGTDSFDSSNPLLSDAGRYPYLYPERTGTNGDIATMYGMLNVGNANVRGDLLLGPTASWDMSRNAAISGSVTFDFNAYFPGVEKPDGTWTAVLPAGSTVVDGISYDHVFLTSGDYTVTALSGNVYISPGAKVRLYIAQNSSPNTIRVAGTGESAAQFTIFMAGEKFTLGGQQTVDSGTAASMTYYGLPSNTTISFSGNASFTGTIYAPWANFSMGGGGSTPYDFVGAAVVKTATLNGHFKFHFDEALTRSGPIKGYVPISWREI